MTNTFVIPDNPGTVMTFVAEQTVRPPVAISDTVALLFTHDWGPLRTPTELRSFSDFEALFGSSDTDGRDGALGCFVGSGVSGSGAQAGAVLAYRMGTSSAAKATHTFAKAGPANALTITALYEGTRGNAIKCVIENDPSLTGYDRLRVLLDDVTVEKYSYVETDIVNLADQINARSKYVTALEVATGTALTAVGATALSGGNDGSAVTVVEYQAGLDALEFADFSVLSAANLEDATIQASLLSWVEGQSDQQRPVELVTGGPTDETFAEAQTRVGTLRSYHHITLGAGNVHDDYLDKDVSFAKFAPRVAGALAGVGQKRALTFLPFAGATLLDPIEVPTDSLRLAADSGITVLTRASAPGADVRVNKGVTTFNDLTDTVHPVRIFGDPRLVRVLDLFLRRVKDRGDADTVGLPNSEETRAHVDDIGKEEITGLVTDGLIINSVDSVPFFNVLPVDESNPDAILFEFGWQFTYTTNYLIGQGRIR